MPLFVFRSIDNCRPAGPRIDPPGSEMTKPCKMQGFVTPCGIDSGKNRPARPRIDPPGSEMTKPCKMQGFVTPEGFKPPTFRTGI